MKVAYIPVLCMQCDNAPCVKAARNRAAYKRPDGIVIIDPKKAVGQRQIVDACPYHVIFWNEEKQLPQKCTFCVQRLEQGKIPKCVQVCPSRALIFGDLEDPKSKVSKIVASGKTEALNPERKAKSRVYYLGVPKLFIAGSVVYRDVDECAEGVSATLTEQSTGKSIETSTNNFGDFEFDGLGAGTYSVKFRCRGYATKTVHVDLKTDKYLGVVNLTKRSRGSKTATCLRYGSSDPKTRLQTVFTPCSIKQPVPILFHRPGGTRAARFRVKIFGP